jgi:hypothetical protein
VGLEGHRSSKATEEESFVQHGIGRRGVAASLPACAALHPVCYSGDGEQEDPLDR